MALELVTGYWGQQHVTAEQDADLNAGIIGREPCILRVGENMRAEAVTANKVRIFDGIFVGYGRVCAIDEGAYEDVEIENGTAGLLRNDMIVIKYVKDEATGIEGVRLAVLKGQTGETATDPTPNNQDIRAGAFESEMPLYRVRLNGLAIEAVERICEMPRTIKDLTSLFGQLNSNLNEPKTRTIEGAYVNMQVTTFGKFVWVRIAGYPKTTMKQGQEYTLFRPTTNTPMYGIYRRININPTAGFVFQMSSVDAETSITPFGGDLTSTSGINVSECYIMK